MSEEQKVDDTFLNFGEGEGAKRIIKGEGNEPDVEVTDVIQYVDEEEEVQVIDYTTKTITEIVEHCKIDVLTNEELTPNFSAVLYKNRYYKLYFGKHSNLGVCSIIVLNGIEEKKQQFGELLFYLKQIRELNLPRILKLHGIVLLKDRAYLVFEAVLSSLSKKIKEKSIEDNGKFAAMFFLIELIMQLHEQKIRLYDIKEDNILYSNTDEFRFLVPFSIFI